MDTAEAKKNLEKMFADLPENIQNAIIAPDLRVKIARIAERAGLPGDAVETLEWQTIFVMSGLLHPAEFVSTITDVLSVSQDKARTVGQEINEDIFRPVKDDLKKLYGIGQNAPPVPEAPKKPLSAELEEQAGVKRPPPAPPPSKPLSKTLEEALETHVSAPREEEPVGIKIEPAKPQPAPPAPKPPVNTEPRDTGFEARPMTVKKYVTPEHEDVEHLSREEILRGIEDPSSIIPKPPQKDSFTPPAPKPYNPPAPSGYKMDPYREPIE